MTAIDLREAERPIPVGIVSFDALWNTDTQEGPTWLV